MANKFYQYGEYRQPYQSALDYFKNNINVGGMETIRQKFNANRGLGQYGLGNIDLYNRPQVKNPDGSISTVRSMSFNDGLKEVVIPTVSDDGKIMTDNQAIDNYYKTGKYLGKFDTVDEATRYAEQLHNEQDRYYNKRNIANFMNILLRRF